MKYLDEYRESESAARYAQAIASLVTRPWTIMEVCGGQTHSIVKFAIDQLLPPGVELVHGPGCPVCVTPASKIDSAIHLATQRGVILTSFGDMMRVPGSQIDLLSAKAGGADIRMVYSPLDAIKLARENPGRDVVFFAVGFETTAPANAMAVLTAHRQRLDNFSILSSHVLVPPAMEAILSAPDCRVQGFLGPGHVCTIMGMSEYAPMCERHRVPIVVTGFEPLDLLQGIHQCLRQLEDGRVEVENQYSRAVQPEGNTHARALMDEVFDVVDREWRGIGLIPKSGLDPNEKYAQYDAMRRFNLKESAAEPSTECIAGQVLRGLRKPADCPAFATRCTPERPLGAPMVSSEGACAAYYQHRARVVS